LNAITGVPQAIASINTKPKGSGQAIGASSAMAPLRDLVLGPGVIAVGFSARQSYADSRIGFDLPLREAPLRERANCFDKIFPRAGCHRRKHLRELESVVTLAIGLWPKSTPPSRIQRERWGGAVSRNLERPLDLARPWTRFKSGS
jgi:hypothetical protein